MSYLKRKLRSKVVKEVAQSKKKQINKRIKDSNKNIKDLDESESSKNITNEGIKYWLMKAEPESRVVKGIDVKFSIDDLKDCKNSISSWEGVRNYEARNFMRDQMKIGDIVLFYHSNCKVPGIAGLAKIVKNGYPDYSAMDPKHPYFDEKVFKSGENKWFMVDIQFLEKFDTLISLKTLKNEKYRDILKDMSLLNRPQLSVQKVAKEEFDLIMKIKDEL